MTKTNLPWNRKKQAEEWKAYIKGLFNNNRSDCEGIEEELEDPEIIRGELRKALSQAKTDKATGPDDLSAELLRLIEIDKNDNLF